MRHAPAFWQSRSFAAILLLPLSLLFTALAALRRSAFRLGLKRVEQVGVPVVVVGNIAVGGSGKTPVVHWLADRLRDAGLTPGIVSRGYGGAITGTALVPANGSAAQFGDEPVLLARLTGCPVAVGADRAAAARALRAAHPEVDVIVSDDGMQHYRLGRAVEIAVVDAATLGNRWCLPAGPLREGVKRLREVDIVIANGALSPDLITGLDPGRCFGMTLEGGSFRSLAEPGRECDAAGLSGRPVHAIAGIGRPQRFFEQLRAMGLDVVPHPFPDHHPFVAADLAVAPGEPKVLTSKDAVKCQAFAPPDTWEFPVVARIPHAAAEIILEKLRHGRPTA